MPLLSKKVMYLCFFWFGEKNMAICLGPVFLFVTASNSSLEQTWIDVAFFFGIGLDGALQRKQEIKNNRKKYGQNQILKQL